MTAPSALWASESEASLLAWQSEIARSVPTPWLAQALAGRAAGLLPRVAACHSQLRALPRSTRRAWQRQLARSSDLAAVLEDWSRRRAGRALRRQFARSLAGAALLLALGYGVGHAATITVGTNIPGIDGGDGKCSLIEAIENANAGGQPHADCQAGSGPDTIVFPKGTLTLGAVDNSTYGDTGLPVITGQLTIEGNGAKLTRKASAAPFRLIAVGATGDLTLRNATLSGGKADYGGAIHNEGSLTIENSVISGNDAAYAGGGLTSAGSLTVESSTVSGNTAGKGNTVGFGAGIATYSGTGVITNSTISGNQAGGRFTAGGGISNGGTLTLDNSTISGNKAGGYYSVGGGIASFADLTITNSTISGNRAIAKYGNAGGGISNEGGTLTVQNSTISGNKAGSAYGTGGGIANYGAATVENSTISGNKANGKYGYGGGIASADAMTIANSTITGNKAGAKLGFGGGVENVGDLTLHRTLISGNKAGEGPEVDNFGGTVTADDFNLFGSSGTPGVVGFTPGVTDVVPPPTVTTGKILGVLKSNGGPTKTRALKVGSPAVDAVPSLDPACSGTDQRGVSRPQGAACDIGAFELE